MRQLYHYYDDGSDVEHPCWASWSSLMQPLVDKSPWLASWDRCASMLGQPVVRIWHELRLPVRSCHTHNRKQLSVVANKLNF